MFEDWTIGNSTYFDTARNAVYLDYKFAQAAATALQIVLSDTEEKNQPSKKRKI
jgi:hypothetical protein